MTPEEFYAILHDVPVPKIQQHRLYYDEKGQPLFYTMEDLSGDWIEVTALDYVLARHDIKIKDGKIIELPKTFHINKLRPAPEGIACHPQDICIVVGMDHPYQTWGLDQHEQN